MKKVFALILTLYTFSNAFSFGNDGNSATGSGTMQVRMTNSESSCVGLILKIINLEVYSEENGWITLNNYEQIISSTSFMSGEESLLANSDLPFGTYSKLRLTFGDGNFIRSTANDIPAHDLAMDKRQIEIPIFQQVNGNSANRVLYIHFDLTTSVTVLEEMYILKPVMEEIANPEEKKTFTDLNTISSTY